MQLVNEKQVTRCRAAIALKPSQIRDGLTRFAAGIATFSFCLLLLAIFMLAAPAVSSAEVAVGVSVTFAPPALPVYIQPLCPGPGYIWVPGYWAWDPDIGYFWVPGTWVLAPLPGVLWTPGYWGWSDDVFVWYDGYWGPVVGFYGGIDYGFGYTGFGYEGGYWRGDTFYYNRTVNNVNIKNITTVYSKPISGPVTATRVSFNGGPGGTTARPTEVQLAAARQQRSSPTDIQKQHERAARSDPKQRAAINHGRPAIAATATAGVLTGRGVIRASRAGAPYKAPSSRAVEHGARVKTKHPARAEKHPSVAATKKHKAPHARKERHVAPKKKPARRGPGKPHTKPKTRPHEAPHAASKRSRTERHEVAPRTAPEKHKHEAPHAAPERPHVEHPEIAPRTAPESPGAVGSPGTSHGAPRRPETSHPSSKEGTKHDEGNPH